jgi:chromosome segregation ATPase
MSENTVLHVGMEAMQALLAENRALQADRDSEKANLTLAIAHCRDHIRMAERVLHVAPMGNSLPKQLDEGLKFLKSVPPLRYRAVPVRSGRDLSESVTLKRTKCLELQTEVTRLSHETTELALEEQKLSAARTDRLNEISARRDICDKLLLQEEYMKSEIVDLKATIECWRQKNEDLNAALASAEEKLGPAQQQKKVRTQELLKELQAMYIALDDTLRVLETPEPTFGGW